MDEATGKEMLAEFGKIITENFDHALDTVSKQMLVGTVFFDKKLSELTREMNDNDRCLTIAQLTLEQFLHDLLASIEESNVFAVAASSEKNGFEDLKNYSAGGLHAEQLNWRERFSRYSSVMERLV